MSLIFYFFINLTVFLFFPSFSFLIVSSPIVKEYKGRKEVLEKLDKKN
ncbi:MAG: hypothetical protein ABIN15_02365 [candidate division WOR-3 bacterium]